MATSLSSQDHAKVRALIVQFEKANNDTKQVYIRDQINDIFQEGGHLLQWRLTPKQVGIHPANRDQAEMNAAGCWLRGGRIANSGFSPQARGKVWAFEDHPKRKHIERHTLAVTSADPRFGKFQPGDVKVGPANWTHSNQFVCMVMDRTPCDHPDLPCRDGHIDSDALTSDPKNARLAEYIAQGMMVTVFPYWVEEQYPSIPTIFQSACNQEQQVQQGENWSQLLKKISNRANEMKRAKKQTTNEDIARAVLRSQPPFPGDVPDMVDFNAKWGGGSSAFFVNDVSHYLTALNVQPNIRVSGRTFRALADLKFEAGTVPAMAVNAVLKRIASSGQAVDGVANIYKISEIASLSKHLKEQFLEANGIMMNSQKILESNKVSGKARVVNEGWLQTTLIDHVLSKPNVDGKTYESMADITKEFLEKCFGAEQNVVDAISSEASSSTAAASMIDYDSKGQAIDVPKIMLQAKGFKVGGRYAPTKPKNNTLEVWELTDIASDGTATLKELSPIGEVTDKEQTIAAADLVAAFKPFEKTFKFAENYPKTEAKYSKALQQSILEFKCIEGLRTVACAQADPKCRVQLSPFKGIFATADIPKGALILAPFTTSVKASTDPNVGFQARVVMHKRTTVFALRAPPVDDDFCNGFFCVMPTHSEEHANMKLVEKAVEGHEPTVKDSEKTSGSGYTVKVDCFVNVKALHPDEQLMYFRPAEVKKEKKRELTITLDGGEAKRGRK